MVSKCCTPEQVLLEGADKPFGTAIALRRADEGGRTLDAEERDLLLEVVRHVLRSVIVAQGEAGGDVFGEAAEVAAHALADRLQRLEPGRPGTGVDADAFYLDESRAWTPLVRVTTRGSVRAAAYSGLVICVSGANRLNRT